MKKIRKPILLLFCVMLIATCMLFYACDFPVITPIVPTPTPPVPDDGFDELTSGELLLRIYNESAENFTANIDVRKNTDGEKEETGCKVVCDGRALKFTRGDDERFYAVGAEYERVGNVEVEEDKTHKTVVGYRACSSDKFQPFEPLDTELTSAADLLLGAVGSNLSVEKTARGADISLSYSVAEAANSVLAVLKKDMDERAVTAVKDILNLMFMTELDEEQAGAMLVLYGDSTFSQLLDMGIPMTRFEFATAYALLKNSLKGSYELPSYEEFMVRYGKLTLTTLLKCESAKDIVGKLNEKTLAEFLKEYEYTDATLSELIASKAETKVSSAQVSVNLAADRNCRISSLEFSYDLKIKSLPVFVPSLGDDNVKEELKDVTRSYDFKIEFSDVGESSVELPESFAFEGEQTLSITGGKGYPVLIGALNSRENHAEPLIRAESEPIEDMQRWAKLMSGIRDGLTVSVDEKTLTVTEHAYECMLKAREMGLSRLTAQIYDEFVFVLEIE